MTPPDRAAEAARKIIEGCHHHSFRIGRNKDCQFHDHDEEGQCFLACFKCIHEGLAAGRQEQTSTITKHLPGCHHAEPKAYGLQCRCICTCQPTPPATGQVGYAGVQMPGPFLFAGYVNQTFGCMSYQGAIIGDQISVEDGPKLMTMLNKWHEQALTTAIAGAVRKWGRHLTGCLAMPTLDNRSGVCTCGLDAAREGGTPHG